MDIMTKIVSCQIRQKTFDFNSTLDKSSNSTYTTNLFSCFYCVLLYFKSANYRPAARYCSIRTESQPGSWAFESSSCFFLYFILGCPRSGRRTIRDYGEHKNPDIFPDSRFFHIFVPSYSGESQNRKTKLLKIC